MGEKLDKLSPRRRAFVVEYVNGDDAGNATECYRRAGYKSKDANRAASRLLTFVDIKEAETELRAETVAKAEAAKILTSAERLEILATIARDNEAKGSDRIKALALDAKLRGEDQPAPQKVEISGPDGGPIETKAEVKYEPGRLDKVAAWLLTADLIKP